jgi:hypothetical protein
MWKNLFALENDAMNRPRLPFRLVALLVTLLVLSGCEEKRYFVTTVVSADGSVDRIIEWRGASDSTTWARLPLPVDSTWRITYRARSSSDSVPVLTASKHFSSYEALAAEYALNPDPVKVRVEVKIASRFRWFYTYYDYAESYGDPDPVSLVPKSSFFSQAELADMASGRSSDTLASRIKEWHSANAKRRLVNRLVEAAGKLGDTSLTALRVEASRALLEQVLLGDSIYAELEHDEEFAHATIDDPSNHRSLAAAAVKPALRALRDIFASPAVDSLRGAVEQALDEYVASENSTEALKGSYTSTVVMPGVLLETNAADVSGSRASWKTDGSVILSGEVRMTAVSRCVNTWAIVVSALAAAALIVASLLLARRRPAV